jgi:two-component system phosphate regulon sensor histidine kinase PhoR
VSQERILVIENSVETQQLLAEFVLKPNGYRSLTALDGEAGLRLALQERPDLIVVDMQLPGMSGIEVLRALREQGVDIPVICTTGHESVEMVVQAFRLGARDYVLKPFGPMEMQEVIRRALSSSTMQEEREQLSQKLVEVNQQLQRQLQELNVIYTLGRSVTSLLDLNQILNRVVESAVYLADAEEGLLLLLDEDESELYLRAAKDIDESVAHNLRVHVDDSVAGRVIKTGRPIFLAGDRAKVTTDYLTKALLYLPLRVHDRGVIGVLGVVNRRREHSFSERDIFVLSGLADYAAIAIENAWLFEQAEAERTKLETVLQNAQSAVIIVDDRNRVQFCNAAARADLRLPKDDALLNRHIDQVVLRPTLCTMFLEVAETGQATRSEVALEDGRTFNAQLTPISGVGRVLMMQDITHLKELDRIKSDFVSSISHDLRTPLTTIQGYVELLPRAGPINEQQQEFILRTRQSMEAITRLLDTVLDIDRLESGLEMEMVDCDLVQLIGESVESIRPKMMPQGKVLKWEVPESLPLVRGNPNRLRQVMDQLLNNALKYTPDKDGWIAVKAHQDDGHVVVHVSDNGIGIPRAEQPYVFEKFYRVESSETVNMAGVGLGLAIVRTVIANHNGRVWLESRPGQGSVFSFVLPALETRR